MRKVIVQEFMSLDGYVAGLNGSVDFIPASTAGDRTFGTEQVALFGTIDTLILGRITYGMFSGYWPNVSQGEEVEFADKFNGVPKIVFSKTLDIAPWGNWEPARVVRTDASEEVAKLKRGAGKDMLVSGSISIAQSLIDRHLVDEYRLILCPIVLGDGRPLFEDTRELKLKLGKATPLSRGGVSLIYEK